MKNILSIFDHAINTLISFIKPCEHYHFSDHMLRDIGIRRDELVNVKAVQRKSRKAITQSQKGASANYRQPTLGINCEETSTTKDSYTQDRDWHNN